MKKWQGQGISPSWWGMGGRGGFAGFLPFPHSLSDWDEQMFCFAEASCKRVFYCSISGHPRQGAGGRPAGTHS